MEKMKSLANELREQMAKPAGKEKTAAPKMVDLGNAPPKKRGNKALDSDMFAALAAYDNADHKTMVHFRFSKSLVDFLNQFKIATGIDATKFAAFAVRKMIDSNPEFKTIIKQFIQNSEL